MTNKTKPREITLNFVEVHSGNGFVVRDYDDYAHATSIVAVVDSDSKFGQLLAILINNKEAREQREHARKSPANNPANNPATGDVL